MPQRHAWRRTPLSHFVFRRGSQKAHLSASLCGTCGHQSCQNFGLYPQKGHLLPGADADIVLFDPNEQWTMGQANSHSNNDWHAYEGFEITGKIRKVFSRGDLIIDGEECLAEKGRGQYLFRKLP